MLRQQSSYERRRFYLRACCTGDDWLKVHPAAGKSFNLPAWFCSVETGGQDMSPLFMDTGYEPNSPGSLSAEEYNSNTAGSVSSPSPNQSINQSVNQ